MSIKQLIYISSETERFTEESLVALLKKARAINDSNNISGLLLYQGGTFLQVLEGPADKIDETMDRIEQDRRHNQIMILSESDETDRYFANWDMGYLILEPSTNFTAPDFTEVMREKFNIDLFRDHASDAQEFIRTFVDSTSVK